MGSIPLNIEEIKVGSDFATPTTIDPYGMWRSLVAHTHGVRGVAGSNPVIPTSRCLTSENLGVLFLIQVKFI